VSDTESPRAPLSITTDLTLAVNGVEANVDSTGERAFVRFRTLSDALRAARGQSGGLPTVVDELLSTTDLTVEVRARDRTLAVFGAGARPGVVSRLVGVDPVELRLAGVIGAAATGVSIAVETAVAVLRGW
jgi:hypothetical protein